MKEESTKRRKLGKGLSIEQIPEITTFRVCPAEEFQIRKGERNSFPNSVTERSI